MQRDDGAPAGRQIRCRWSFRCSGLNSHFSQICKCPLRWARTEQSRVGTYACSSAVGGPLPLPAKLLLGCSAAKWSVTSCLFRSPRHPSETGNIRLLHSLRSVFYSFFRLVTHWPLIPPLPLFSCSHPFSPSFFSPKLWLFHCPSLQVSKPPGSRLCLKKSRELNN